MTLSAPLATVAIPVLEGGPLLGDTLDAVRAQQVDGEVELLVADSGSRDGSRERAVRAGATIIDVAPGQFSHGATRNDLMAAARGSHVAFLTQDATPADPGWLSHLLDGFALADDVALVFGPYRPRESASPMVRRELESWFASFAPDGRPRVDRAGGEPADTAERDRRAFFSDANGCVSRRAWEEVPFRAVSYAEDQMLARDMLGAGWAKAYHPAAAVVHSHDYTPGSLLRRAFDEARALREVAGQSAHGGPRSVALVVQREVRDDLGLLGREGAPLGRRLALAPRSLAHHSARTVGAALGARAQRLPRRLRRALSLEGREGFDPQC